MLVLTALDVVFKCFVGSTAQQFLPLRTSKILAHQNVFIQLSSSIQLQFRPLLQRRRTSLKSQRIQEQREGFYLFVCSFPLWDSPRTKKENSSQSGKNRTAKVCAAWHTIKYYWFGKWEILYSQPAPSSKSHSWLQRLRFPSPLETSSLKSSGRLMQNRSGPLRDIWLFFQFLPLWLGRLLILLQNESQWQCSYPSQFVFILQACFL